MTASPSVMTLARRAEPPVPQVLRELIEPVVVYHTDSDVVESTFLKILFRGRTQTMQEFVYTCRAKWVGDLLRGYEELGGPKGILRPNSSPAVHASVHALGEDHVIENVSLL